MSLGYFGINMHRHYRHEFMLLMQEAGYKYVGLEELIIHLGAVLISYMQKGITDVPASIEYVHWNKELHASLRLLPPEARVHFVEATCLAYEQTRLSS